MTPACYVRKLSFSYAPAVPVLADHHVVVAQNIRLQAREDLRSPATFFDSSGFTQTRGCGVHVFPSIEVPWPRGLMQRIIDRDMEVAGFVDKILQVVCGVGCCH